MVPAQTKGCRITKVTALARATNTATELQLFTSTDSGTTKKFVDSALMAAYTVAQTTKQTKTDFGFGEATPLILAGGENLYAVIGVSNAGIVFRAEGGAMFDARVRWIKGLPRSGLERQQGWRFR